MPSRTVYGSLNGNGQFWSNDPNGAFFRGTRRFSTTAPVVTVTSAQDTLPAIGSTVTCTYTSTQPGFWYLSSNVPGAVLTESADGLSCSITFVPEPFPVCTIYVSAGCWNVGGVGIGTARVHPGMRGVVRVGAGWDYPHCEAAFAAIKALPQPGGYAFVVKNGTYTNAEMFITYNAGGPDQPNQPPCGEFTASGAQPNTLYTITRFTSLVAETPFGVILDGQGTRPAAVQMYGNTRRESEEQDTGLFGENHYLAFSGTDRRGIHIAGFVSNDTAGGGFVTYYCDGIFFEYLICGEVSRLSPNQNNVGVHFHSSKDCLMENIYTFGAVRYKQSTYQSKRCRVRRGFQRFDVVKTGEPHGGVSFYRASWNKAQNVLHFDSDQLLEFDTSSPATTTFASIDAGFLALPTTQAEDYPHHNYFERCLMYNSRLGFALNDARQVTGGFSEFQWNNVGAWYTRGKAEAGGNCAIAQSGPVNFDRMTAVNIDTAEATYGLNAYAKPVTTNNSVICRFGYSDAGVPRANGTFALAYSPTNNNTFSNCDFYQLSYAAEKGGSTPSAVTYANCRTDYDPFTQGIRYPGRIEPGSPYDTMGRGQDRFYHAEGKRGHFHGMADADTDTGDNWLDQAMIPLALPFFRAYSYTGATNTQGIQTLSGNRGGAQTDKLLVDYIISDRGNDVPFPLSVRIQKIGTLLRVSWRTFASAYMTNVTGWKIFLDGGHAQTTEATSHAVDFSGLIPGRIYKFKLIAVDSVHGESGPSYEFQAAA